MRRDSVAQTFKVAVLLCVVCSVLVSGAAVSLRERQRANKERARKANILAAAGLADEARQAGVEAVYARRITERLIDLEAGQYVSDQDPTTFDQRRAARDSRQSDPVAEEDDVARVRRRERQSLAFLVKDNDGRTDQIVLPIRGYGLWSTLWGFVALDAQAIVEGPADITVSGLNFYEHSETPGLGGEVDNPRWQDKWREDKRIYDDQWNVLLRVIKGEVPPADEQADYKVDGLSGATLTSNGVTNMIAYWFGEHGFRPFLQRASQQPEMLAAEGGGNG
jgi:Na+-transporting NADH:ubiquinone oxidoreductase subunit C